MQGVGRRVVMVIMTSRTAIVINAFHPALFDVCVDGSVCSMYAARVHAV